MVKSSDLLNVSEEVVTYLEYNTVVLVFNDGTEKVISDGCISSSDGDLGGTIVHEGVTYKVKLVEDDVDLGVLRYEVL